MAGGSYVIRCRVVFVSILLANWSLLCLVALSSSVSSIDISEAFPNEESVSLPESDEVYNKGTECMCRQHFQHPQEEPLQGHARLFYLILVHNEATLLDSILLFRALRDPRNIILVHVDPKAFHVINATSLNAYEVLLAEINECPCGSRVRIESKHSVEWSRWSMNLPTLWGMQVAVEEYADEWDVFINLSGDSLPVYTPNTMARIWDSLKDYSFVTSRACETGWRPTSVYDFPEYWHKRVHYTRRETEAAPEITFTSRIDGRPEQQETLTVVPHFGSQWVAVPKSFCKYLVNELQYSDSLPSLYRDYLIKGGKVMTDEVFLPTILMHVNPFNASLPPVIRETGALDWGKVQKPTDNWPPIGTLRYERMDEHVPTGLKGLFPTQPHYHVPEVEDDEGSNIETNNLLKEPNVWGPYYLGVYDLANIRLSGALFVRKVSQFLDPNLYRLLPVDKPEEIPMIQWPANGVKVSPVPNWQRRKREIIAEAKKKALEHEEKQRQKLEQETQRHVGAKKEEQVDEPRTDHDKANDRSADVVEGEDRHVDRYAPVGDRELA